LSLEVGGPEEGLLITAWWYIQRSGERFSGTVTVFCQWF